MIEGPQTVIFFGASGSGKGTQSELLKKYFEESDSSRKVLYLETGDRFREFVSHNDSYSAKRTQELMNKGELLPEFLPIWAWSSFLIDQFTGEEHLIFDGLARRQYEAPILRSALQFYRRDNVHVIYLKTTREVVEGRLLERARADDTPEDIKERLDWFYENTYPAIEYFKEETGYHFIEVDGEKSIEDIHKDVADIFENHR